MKSILSYARSLLAITAVAALCLAPIASEARPDLHPDDLSSIVLAQVPEPDPTHETVVYASSSPAPSFLESVLNAAFTPAGITVLVGVVGSVLALIFGSSAVRKRRIALGVYHAFQIVNDIDAERGDSTLDKPREGLRALDDWMKANGWRPLKPGEEKQALLGFQQLHGQEKQAVKIAAEAQAKAAAVVPQTPLAAS